MVFLNNVSFAAAAAPLSCAYLEEYIMASGRSFQKLRRDIAFLGSILKETKYILLSLSPKGVLVRNKCDSFSVKVGLEDGLGCNNVKARDKWRTQSQRKIHLGSHFGLDWLKTDKFFP